MADIVPFGKYRGQPIDVLAADSGYCDWLIAQAWFRERYGNVYTLIVNNFGEPTETPDHNALQARFLDEAFCRATLSAIGWQPVSDAAEFVKKKMTAEYNSPIPILQRRILQLTNGLNETRLKLTKAEEKFAKAQTESARRSADLIETLRLLEAKICELGIDEPIVEDNLPSILIAIADKGLLPRGWCEFNTTWSHKNHVECLQMHAKMSLPPEVCDRHGWLQPSEVFTPLLDLINLRRKINAHHKCQPLDLHYPEADISRCKRQITERETELAGERPCLGAAEHYAQQPSHASK